MTVLLISPDLHHKTLRNVTNFLPILHNQQKFNLLQPKSTSKYRKYSSYLTENTFTKTNWLMLHTKIASHCLLCGTEHTKSLHGENSEFLNFEIGAVNSNHCDLKN
jgi:hypothetical protein